MADVTNIFGNFNLSGMVDKVVIGAMWIFLIIVVAAIGLIIYKVLIYKYQIFVIERIGGHLKVISTKAKQVNMKGDKGKSVKKLFLKKYGKLIKIPTEDAWQDFKNKKALFLGFDGINSFFPLKLTMASAPLFEPISYDWLFWHSLQTKETNQLYDEQGFWQKHGPAVMWSFVIVLTFVLLIVLFQRLESVSGAISSLAGAVKGVSTQTIAGSV